MNSEVQDYSGNRNATFNERLVAYFIDMMAWKITTKICYLPFLFIDLKPTSAIVIQSLIETGCFCLFFIGSQMKYGQTLGKYMVRIKTIPLDPDEIPSFGMWAYRETFARVVSLLPLGWGHWRIYHDHNLTTLHDDWSKTKVISLKSE